MTPIKTHTAAHHALLDPQRAETCISIYDEEIFIKTQDRDKDWEKNDC